MTVQIILTFTLSEETTAYNDVFPWNYYYVEYDVAPATDEKNSFYLVQMI